MKADKSKRHVIMVYGAPGSGKTFFSEKFSEVFRAPLLDLNSLRHMVLSKPNYDKNENLFVRKIGMFLLGSLMRANQTVILEGCLDTKQERDDFRQVIKDSDYEPILVWVQTDLATTKQRAMSRERSKMSKKHFDEVVAGLEAPTSKESPVVISGKHTFATQIKIVLGQLSSK